MNAISKILRVLESATNLPIKPFETDVVEDCIVYKYSSISDNGIVAQQKLELRIIGKTYADVVSIETKVKSALITIGDEQKVQGLNSVELNGGGTLKDYSTNTIHSLLYFIIKIKSEVN